MVTPLADETLPSYLGRLAHRNRLPSRALVSLVTHRPDAAATVALLTGLPRRHIVSALPGTRTAGDLRQWPHLLGRASAAAAITDACQHCTAASGDPGGAARIHATHDHVLCLAHHRWTGGPLLDGPASIQFDIARCPDIVGANLAHRRLISQWGRTRVRFWFEEAVITVQAWRHTGATATDSCILDRARRLHSLDAAPGTPHDWAAHYPTVVDLTHLLLAQRHDIDTRGAITRDLAEEGRTRISTSVVAGLRPSGAWDPYLRALRTDFIAPRDETEPETAR